MLMNRSAPKAPVIPVLAYPDVDAAAEWLCAAFGFRVRLRIAKHRIQMHAGEGAVIIRELRPDEENVQRGLGCSVMIRIVDADAHCRRAQEHGAVIVQEPVTYFYGERQYHATDFAGYRWDFTETLEDVDPASWGGIGLEL